MIDVKHIAKLARLGLAAKEKEKFEKELLAILDFVAKLNEINTKNIEPTAQVTGTINIFREDQSNPISEDIEIKENILKNAPQKEGSFYKVKRVLE